MDIRGSDRSNQRPRSNGRDDFWLSDLYGEHVGRNEEVRRGQRQQWFTQAWKDKIAGAFTDSSNFSGDKMNTLFGLIVNAMQHGMIYVSLGMLPTANKPEYLQRIEGPGPDAWNRSSSSIGAMASSFGLEAGQAPSVGDLETAEA
jgi:NAD(P)H dehydrogenase (quinone)